MRATALAVVLAAALAWAAPAGSAPPRGATVAVTDNAFARGGEDRPTVRVRRGATVRWQWRSQESHQVTVRSGPRRFASRTQAHGSYAHRFTRRGTYRLVCSIHAPGMRMTVVVR